MIAGVIIQPPPARAPDLLVTHARAWHCSHPDADAAPAAVDAWLLRTDPIGAYWQFGAISLDPARGVDRRQLQFRDATHEFSILGLDATQAIPDPGRWEGVRFLALPEVKVQVELHPGRRGDAEARAVVGQMVMAVIDAQMSPESANRPYWLKAIKAVAEDFRENRRYVRRSEW